MGIVIAVILSILGLWLLFKVFAVFLKLLKYLLFALPLFILGLIFIPGPIDEGVLFIFCLLLAIAKSAADSMPDGSYNSYVLNKKSKVIHPDYSHSASTISEKNRKPISSSEAWNLAGRGGKYRFKKED